MDNGTNEYNRTNMPNENHGNEYNRTKTMGTNTMGYTHR